MAEREDAGFTQLWALAGEYLPPLFGFGEALKEPEPLAEEGSDVGNQDEAGNEPTGSAERKVEANFIFEQGATGGWLQVMIVLEGGESTLFLGVLEEGGLGVGGDEGVVDLREEELPAAPGDAISHDDVA